MCFNSFLENFAPTFALLKTMLLIIFKKNLESIVMKVNFIPIPMPLLETHQHYAYVMSLK